MDFKIKNHEIEHLINRLDELKGRRERKKIVVLYFKININIIYFIKNLPFPILKSIKFY